jgi:hypothetical protein
MSAWILRATFRSPYAPRTYYSVTIARVLVHLQPQQSQFEIKKAATQNDGCLDDLKDHCDFRGRSVIHDDDEFLTWSRPADATEGFVSDANVPYSTDDGGNRDRE